ncbi:hypothetical protein [Actinomadura sp. WMMB 499]|uniref:hypothetical protein n=1 Tax=Actinomadura sp. WMMB 499 TaxID=1219491 RepID=UPI001245E82C|nr:hypothetical protein [Actinomadura sp. WMMB 499]QFG26072.1 hypothetical protein F7P10_37975 [Actinomadura sp. WMMB 499]
MPPKTRLSTKGKQLTVYVEHGIWYDRGTRRIHVTVPGADGMGVAHWDCGPADKRWTLYKAILQEAGRWPEDAPE